jgi:hypothetical protein
MLGSSISALVATLLLGGSFAGIPRVSQCAAGQAGQTIMGSGFIVLGFAFVRMSRLVFNFMEGAMPQSQVPYIGLTLCILSAFSVLGISLAPISRFETEATLDEMTCILFLSFALLCVILHLGVMRTEWSAAVPLDSPLSQWQSLLVGLGTFASVAFVLLRPFPYSSVRAFLEWISMLLLCVYMYSVRNKITDDVVLKRPRVNDLGVKAVV